MRRTSSTCKNILDYAIGLGVIVRWRDFYQRSYDYERPCWVEIDYPNFTSKSFNGHNFEEAFGFAADHVLDLYPKEAAVNENILDKAVADKAIAGWRSEIHISVLGPATATVYVTDREGCEATFRGGQNAWKRAEEFALGSYPKENTVLTLSQVVKRLYDEHCGNERYGYLLFCGDDAAVVDKVHGAYEKYSLAGGPVTYLPFHKVYGKPTENHNCSAAIIVHLSGTLDDIEINVTKNRFGNTFTMHCNALLEETTVETLHPDSSSYVGCFRILREAKNDGVISRYWMNSGDESECPYLGLYGGHRGAVAEEMFLDEGGTKGDIGLLRLAAAYCLELRKKRQPKKTSAMTSEELAAEIDNSGYTFRMDMVANSNLPTLGLWKRGGGLTPCGLSMQFDEVRDTFLERCVNWIREQK